MWQAIIKVIEMVTRQAEANFTFLTELVVLLFIYLIGAHYLEKHGDTMLLATWLTGGAVIGSLLRAFQGPTPKV